MSITITIILFLVILGAILAIGILLGWLSASLRLRELMGRQKEELIGKLSIAEAQLQAKKLQDAQQDQTQKEISMQFENLANKIFEDKSRNFARLNQENLNHLLDPLKQNIADFRKKVEDVYDKDSKDRSTLQEQIRHLAELNQQVSKDADNLATALKGDSKVMGNWGELALERLLEISGLEKGRDYELQVTTHSQDGNRLRPDVVVHLPENRDIIIDSKVSLLAYDRYCSTENSDELLREENLKAHIHSIRRHIQDLSTKSYESIRELHSLDYVLMFLPIEAAYITAIKFDPTIFSDAVNKKILIVCPSTLMITLRTIATIWRYEKQNENAKEIARKATSLYNKFFGFLETLRNLRKGIQRASEECEKAERQLATGRSSLIDQVKGFEAMGIEPKKQIDKGIFSDTE